jgi:hypothetical protein
MQELEGVLWGLADLYDIFLEAFDKRIQNSNLKKVTRMGEYEWHVSDSGSKSYILVYQRGNDIICWLKMGISGILSFIIPLVTKIEIAIRNAITEAETDILMDVKKNTLVIHNISQFIGCSIADSSKFMASPVNFSTSAVLVKGSM